MHAQLGGGTRAGFAAVARGGALGSVPVDFGKPEAALAFLDQPEVGTRMQVQRRMTGQLVGQHRTDQDLVGAGEAGDAAGRLGRLAHGPVVGTGMEPDAHRELEAGDRGQRGHALPDVERGVPGRLGVVEGGQQVTAGRLEHAPAAAGDHALHARDAALDGIGRLALAHAADQPVGAGNVGEQQRGVAGKRLHRRRGGGRWAHYGTAG